AEQLHQPGVNVLTAQQRLKAAGALGAAVLADAQEDDPVDDPLNGEVERGLIQVVIAQGQIRGKLFAPIFDLFEEHIVEWLRAAATGGGAVAVEVAPEHRLFAEGPLDEIPAVAVVVVGEKVAARDGRLVKNLWWDAAVVDRQLLKVGKQRDGELAGPGVTSELVSRL